MEFSLSFLGANPFRIFLGEINFDKAEAPICMCSVVHFSCFSFITFTGSAKSSTLPLPHRLGGNERPVTVRERDRDRDGYYSDRNELIRERERDRDRDRGYLSDNS